MVRQMENRCWHLVASTRSGFPALPTHSTSAPFSTAWSSPTPSSTNRRRQQRTRRRQRETTRSAFSATDGRSIRPVPVDTACRALDPPTLHRAAGESDFHPSRLVAEAPAADPRLVQSSRVHLHPLANPPDLLPAGVARLAAREAAGEALTSPPQNPHPTAGRAAGDPRPPILKRTSILAIDRLAGRPHRGRNLFIFHGVVALFGRG